MARRCRHCKSELPPIKKCTDPFQAKGFCNVDHMAAHGIEKARQQKEKARRQETRKAKERIKTRAEHLREAQAAFNAYIRERDKGDPCISCGRHHQGQYHAGHYRSVGACPELRFCESNVHKQCAPCNNHKSGNIVEYRINLARKIGDDILAWIEGPHDAKRYTIDQAKEIKSKYRKALRDMRG